MKPEYLNLYEFEILERVLNDLPDLTRTENDLKLKIVRIINYIRHRRHQDPLNAAYSGRERAYDRYEKAYAGYTEAFNNLHDLTEQGERQ